VGFEKKRVFSNALLQRVLLSVVLVPLLYAAVKIEYLGGCFFFLFVLSLSVLSARELFTLFAGILVLNRMKWWPCCLPQAVLIILYYLNSFFATKYLGILYIAGSTCALQAVCGAFFYTGRKVGERVALSLLGYVYTGLFPLALFAVRAVHGPPYVYLLFLLGWISDAAAYLVGTRYGRKRGIVRWSPQKSLEGYISAFCITIAAAVAIGLLFIDQFDTGVWRIATLGFVISVTAPAGDIVESALKRKAEKKDSSGLLPGFGGVLDIFDSILLSAPVYLLLLFVL
jgi:phosphatidate cytidylyltransferase